jgi:hypothetical protein
MVRSGPGRTQVRGLECPAANSNDPGQPWSDSGLLGRLSLTSCAQTIMLFSPTCQFSGLVYGWLFVKLPHRLLTLIAGVVSSGSYGCRRRSGLPNFWDCQSRAFMLAICAWLTAVFIQSLARIGSSNVRH